MPLIAYPNRWVRFEVQPLADHDPSAPVVAVNWFDLRSPRLYRAYTLLAGQRVLRFGGRLLLKASRVGPATHPYSRQTLLLVRWPDLQSFLNLLEDPVFNIVSPLRLGAVQRFRFGFTRGIRAKQEPAGLQLRQIHLATDVLEAAIARLPKGVRVVYAGPSVARNVVRLGSKPARVLPLVAEAVLTVAGPADDLVELDRRLVGLHANLVVTSMISRAL